MFDSQPDAWHENWNSDNCEVVWRGGVVETLKCSSVHMSGYNIGKLYADIHKDGYHMLVIDGNETIIEPNGSFFSPFGGKKITSVIINNGVTGIGSYAFDNSSLTSIIIPDSVTIIGYQAFRNSSLTSIIIPDSVTSINGGAF
jgi:hypothetical protein